MVFTSMEFVVFLPTVVAAYYLMPHRWRWAVLLAASYVFYMSWRPVYGLLLLGTTALAYVAGLLLERYDDERTRKYVLLGSLLALLAVLFTYKYFNFFNDTLRAIVTALTFEYRIEPLSLILPLGISFFTFQKIAYIVDVYQRRVPAERHFGQFALFAAFFPQLVAGPIERAKHLLPELKKQVRFDPELITSGLTLITWGFFKKTVVADRLAPIVAEVYGSPQQYDGPLLLFATLGFAFQVYCDFSAYSDIAVGSARTMGIKLTQNFRQPYFAVSIGDFWKRWHISLSMWLTDYVYTPLTRSKAIPLRWYPKFLLCLFLTFLVSGLWHGANWTFIAWGALHGGYLVFSMLSQNLRKKLVQVTGLGRVAWLRTTVRVLVTFCLVCFTYIFFRASSLSDATYIATHLFDGMSTLFSGEPLLLQLALQSGAPNVVIALVGIAIVMMVDASKTYGWRLPALEAVAVRSRWTVQYVGALTVLVFGALYEDAHTFIYFQF